MLGVQRLLAIVEVGFKEFESAWGKVEFGA